MSIRNPDFTLEIDQYTANHNYQELTVSAPARAKLIEWSKQLHWLKVPVYGVPELYLDNHMMQTFRACESKFWLEFVEGYGSKNHHAWFLDFGTAVHSMIEYYYMHRKDPNFDVFVWSNVMAEEVWNKLRIEEYYSPGKPWAHNGYETLGGLAGFKLLMLQYAHCFQQENERFRVIGAELYFGKAKEVPLGEASDKQPFRLYLCGKIDLLMDDGYSIGPMDHKTSSNFYGKNPSISYEVHEGMIGYVYAARALVKKIVEAERVIYGTNGERNVNKIWINHIQVAPLPEKRRNGTIPELSERFRRVPHFYTDWQLEQYRLRQISTAQSIIGLLLDSRLPTRNTMMCTNYMRHTCSFQEVHRQNSAEAELIQLNSSFTKRPIWDPENRDNDNLISEGD